MHALPRGQKEGDLYRTLLARRTVRVLDCEATLSVDDLGTILRYTFGCHGYVPIRGGGWILKKTSPSGGSLHPIEAYPLIRRVSGDEPGLYHYNVERHGLELMRSTIEEEATRLADLFAAGQSYACDAEALIVMTARFPRSFWKYANHEKAYGVILMDAGHLSKTLYLVCTDLGLGPFVTAAINDRNIEEALGIDGFSEGAIAVLGVGAANEGKGRIRSYLPTVETAMTRVPVAPHCRLFHLVEARQGALWEPARSTKGPLPGQNAEPAPREGREMRWREARRCL